MISAYARLKPDATVAQARTELATIFSRRSAAYGKFYPASAGFAPLIAPVDTELTHAARPTFVTLLAAAGLVLLLASANLANLALSRQMRRSREMAIRMATGASPANIFRQLLTESMLVALAGGVLGVTLGRLRFEAPHRLCRAHDSAFRRYTPRRARPALRPRNLSAHRHPLRSPPRLHRQPRPHHQPH